MSDELPRNVHEQMDRLLGSVKWDPPREPLYFWTKDGGWRLDPGAAEPIKLSGEEG